MTRTLDVIETELAEASRLIAGLEAVRVALIRELDVAQVALADGCLTMTDWVASRLDVEHSTARTLLDIARSDDPAITDAMVGGMTLDRAAAVARLASLGVDRRTITESLDHDLAAVRRITAEHRTMTSAEETALFDGRYLHLQPSLDESMWKLWGQVTGVDGITIDKALRAEIDALPHHPAVTAGPRRADALVSVCTGFLETTSGPVSGSTMTADVFIDAGDCAPSDGSRGATVVGGPRVGPNTLAEILCTGSTRVIVTDDHLTAVSTTRRSRAIPSAVRAAVLRRDRHGCVIDGCRSTTRLQPHHIRPWSEGGDHAPDNLATLCWFHHHVVIHQLGYQIDPDTPARRRRLHPNPKTGP